MVTVVVFGHILLQAVEEPELELEVSGPTTVRQLLEANLERLGGLKPLLDKGEILVTVNRKVSDLTSTVRDGDTVKLTHNHNPTYEGMMWHNP